VTRGLRALSLAIVLSAGGLGLACKSVSDVLFEPPAFTPLPDQQGRFRVTFGSGADVVRGFMADGRLLFRAFDLVPFGDGWILASVPPDGGQVREEAGVYRPVFVDQMGALVSDGTRRALALWKPPIPGFHGCPDSSITTLGTPGPAPRPPSPLALTIYSLPLQDGVPISSLISRDVPIDVITITHGSSLFERVRVTPVLRDVARTGNNAFGPVLLPGTEDMVYSDGERLWRASIVDTTVPPLLLGDGAYPALSPDGRSLAYARPLGLDSTEQIFTIPVGLVGCVQTQVEITASAWEVQVRDIESWEEQAVTDGMEAAFDPLRARLVVRAAGELQWFDLATLSSVAIPGTRGAFAPAISPDGSLLAFSLFSDSTNIDVYLVKIDQ
jgi:hypothetical protein